MFRIEDGIKIHAWMLTRSLTQYVEVIVSEKRDPLDFQEVPIKEAVARINDAGFFILLTTGEIYKIDPNSGAITLQNRRGLTKTLAGRQARCDTGKSISASLAWLQSPDSREYDSIGYWPSNRGRPAKSRNLWQGWGIGRKPGDWSLIDDYILDVAGGDRNPADFILDWCAHIVQRPWEKPGVALVFRDRNGTAENLLAEVLAAIIGQQNAVITANGEKIFEKSNWRMAGKLLIVAKAFVAGKHELKHLKRFLTGEEIQVDQRYGHTLKMKSMHRIIINLDHHQVIDASEDECRLFECGVLEKRHEDDHYFDPLRKAARGENNALLAAFFDALLARDISNWKPERAARKILAGQKLQTLEPRCSGFSKKCR